MRLLEAFLGGTRCGWADCGRLRGGGDRVDGLRSTRRLAEPWR